MPFGGLLTLGIIGGAGSIIGGSLSNKSSTTPTLDPTYSPLQQQMLKLLQGRLSGPSALPAGLETGGVRSINNTFDVAKQTSDQSLVRRGLATSPVAATVDTARNNERAGAVGTFRAGLPLIAQQLQTQDLGLANSALAQGRGTQTESGGGAAGAATNLSQFMGYFLNSKKFNGGE